MSWADGVARATIRNGKVYADGTVHTLEGWERRLIRDRARNRARVVVKHQHPDEYDAIVAADPDRRESRKRARAYRALADLHPDEYRTAYEQALADQGYESEFQSCNSVSPTATVALETSGPGAALTARDRARTQRGVRDGEA